MSEYTEELLKNLSIIGCAGHRLLTTTAVEKKAPAQQLVLDILAEEDGLTQGVLAEILDIRPSSLTEVLKKLENRGEIIRKEDPADKRIKQVFLTEIGRAKATPDGGRTDRSEEFFAGLTEEELQQLEQLMNKIANGWVEDFCDLSEFPRTPLEALDSLKEFKKQFEQDFVGRDMRDMTMEERRQIKREMKKLMRQRFGRHGGFRQRDFERWPFDRSHNFDDFASREFTRKADDGWDDW